MGGGRLANMLILFAGTNGQDLCLNRTVTAALKRDFIEHKRLLKLHIAY